MSENNKQLETYQELYIAFDFFNHELFSNRLPQCLITLQREKHTYGYYSPDRWVHTETSEKRDEIALNPSYFGIRPIKESLSTLVHEMTHLEQAHFGKAGRRGYHNQEWGKLMLRVGLYPSSTGKKGGKMVGDRMSHYIIKGGAFDQSCTELLTREFTISWADRFPPVQPTTIFKPILDDDEDQDDDLIVDIEDDTETLINPLFSFGYESDDDTPDIVLPSNEDKSNRCKFTCTDCKQNAWGKPSLKLICGICNKVMELEE